MKARIGCQKYEISLKEPMFQITDCGFCDWEEQTIGINPAKNSVTKKQTFWHETIHAMLFELGYCDVEDKGVHNEKFVDSLAKLLYALHEDNDIKKIYEFLEK